MPSIRKRVEFAICVADEGYDDLEVWKVYRVLPDAKAAEVGCIRVIDESGEDYLYPPDGSSLWIFRRKSGRGCRDGSQLTLVARCCMRLPKADAD